MRGFQTLIFSHGYCAGDVDAREPLFFCLRELINCFDVSSREKMAVIIGV